MQIASLYKIDNNDERFINKTICKIYYCLVRLHNGSNKNTLKRIKNDCYTVIFTITDSLSKVLINCKYEIKTS